MYPISNRIRADFQILYVKDSNACWLGGRMKDLRQIYDRQTEALFSEFMAMSPEQILALVKEGKQSGLGELMGR